MTPSRTAAHFFKAIRIMVNPGLPPKNSNMTYIYVYNLHTNGQRHGPDTHFPFCNRTSTNLNHISKAFGKFKTLSCVEVKNFYNYEGTVAKLSTADKLYPY
jgi:hypothetical protein